MKDKERNYIMIKGPIKEENIIFVNASANIYLNIKDILTDIKGETDKNTIIVGKSNSPLTWMDRSSRKKEKVNDKETVVLSVTLDHLHLKRFHSSFHIKAAEYNLFQSTYGIFSRTDNILGLEISFNKFKRIEIISRLFYVHNMKLEINYRKKKRENTNTWKLNSMLLKYQWINEENPNISRQMKIKTHFSKIYEMQKKNSPKREVFSETVLSQEIRKILTE